MPAPTLTREHRLDLTRRSFELVATATTVEELATVLHPEWVNREAVAEPPEARTPGPVGALATARWLQSAYSELEFTVHEMVVDGDLVVAHLTMSGRHTGDFVVYGEDGTVERAFAPTGRRFAVPHTHWSRFQDDLLVEHWANRDDMGQAMQLGWVPPTPLYLIRCALATRRARKRAQRQAEQSEQSA